MVVTEDLNGLELPALFEALVDDGCFDRLLAIARDEDLGEGGDVTSAVTISADLRSEVDLRAREAGVVAGIASIRRVVAAFDVQVTTEPLVADGERCAPGQVLARLLGPTRDLLAIERTLLNVVGRLSGIATSCRRFVDAVEGTGAVICDTRKTTPGLRAVEKYAVRCGGGVLHRCGLYDAVLIKDNHIAAAGGDLDAVVRDASRAARESHSLRFVEVEVDTLDQLRSLLTLEPGVVDIVLLDNMVPEMLREAVAMRDAQASTLRLEASGGVTLETVASIAAAGVDRISIGALTHSAPALDVGFDLE